MSLFGSGKRKCRHGKTGKCAACDRLVAEAARELTPLLREKAPQILANMIGPERAARELKRKGKR